MTTGNPSTETSGKPADIPQDVWGAADIAVHTFCNNHHLWGDLGSERVDDLHEIVARAIMAAKAEEREGCLSDLQAILDDLPSHDPGVCLDMATRAIRKRGEG